MKIILVVSILAASAFARTGFGPTEQEWGYATVRPQAHIFWWLHQTTANVETYTDRPLVIWLQGGPGASSTGYGNFAEIGPLDSNLEERATTWVKDVNVLFVDNPVGTGYSYTESRNDLATTNRQIAEDFLEFLTQFYEQLPEWKNTPLYIFCESYGGKMTAEIALVVDQAVKDGKLDIELKGIGLGDSWISPVDSVMTWAPFLREFGFVDQNGYEQIQYHAELTRDAVENGNYDFATNLWGLTEQIVLDQTHGVDFYNVLTKITGFEQTSRSIGLHKLRSLDSDVDSIMRNEVKNALNLTNSYGSQSGAVFSQLSEDFMKPVINIVEELLNNTDIKVAVYNGQLDLIVDTPGTIKWVDEMKFLGSEELKDSPREAVVVDGIIEGFKKEAGNLHLYWVNRAGHMVPSDNAAAMRYILSEITDNFATKKN